SANRLSNLPDGITHHILLFLDIKSVVQTSVLSPMWRSAWKDVPALNFCKDNAFRNDQSFGKLVNKVLALRNQQIRVDKITFVDEFVSLPNARYKDLLGRVVEYASSNGTRHLVAVSLKGPESIESISEFSHSQHACQILADFEI
ncbi:Putative F-box/FBD/LRR-repeat protein At4g03220, partial [Linum grandiflorum]